MACPLAAPGQGKSGGMNVHVRQLARALGDLGIQVDIFTRHHSEPHASVEEISPDVRVVHLAAGEPDTLLEDMFSCLPQFLQGILEFQQRNGFSYQAVHSHYWLSGWAGRTLAQTLAVPHIVTFHTLALIKMQSRAGEREPLQRQQTEGELMASADQIVAFSPHERDAMVRLYGADPSRIRLVPCGVDLSTFRPLDQAESPEKVGSERGKCISVRGTHRIFEGAGTIGFTPPPIWIPAKEYEFWLSGATTAKTRRSTGFGNWLRSWMYLTE